MITFDSSELVKFSSNLGQVAKGTLPAMTKVFDDAGDQLVKTWADNARESSGQHGRHYPNSIDSERVISSDIVVEVGPNPAKPQGRMAFETGSVNQPPHPAGQQAADREIPLLQRRVSLTIADLLGQL